MNHARILVIAAAAVSFAISQAARAQPFDYYFSGNAGIGQMKDIEGEIPELGGGRVDYDFDSGPAFSAALGAAGRVARTELEVFYQENDLAGVDPGETGLDTTGAGVSGDISLLMGFINVYLDMNTNGVFRPFITGGLGLARVDGQLGVSGFDELSLDDGETTVAYHVGLGAGFAVSENVLIDLRYRYLLSDDVDIEEVSSNLVSHGLLAGIRVHF